MNIVEPIRSKNDIRKIEKLLANKSQRDLLMFVMGTNSGLRISDILGLNVSDVKNKSHICIIEKKTGKRKQFPINPKLKLLIENFIKDRHEDEPLFLTKYNGRLDRIQAYRILNTVCKQVGINFKIGTHTLRKTFGYHHYQQFKDVAMLQKIFNHSTPSITLRYIGIEQDEIDESYNNFIL